MKRRAVFLDRDGVINRALVREGKPYPPATLAELEILPEVPATLTRLHQAGFWLIVVTNQPDVARGTQTQAMVEAFHQQLQKQLPIDEFRVCYHDDTDHCDCRKPLPGLLVKAAQALNLELAKCFMVGDRWRDIEAGQRAGCITIFIDYHYRERQPTHFEVKVNSLSEAVQWILDLESLH
ncbi:MAG: D,D-heptose 1,7-bisphosphate phosphatase [Thiotrichaceae bacterium IS1]|nr:MAG: D,D-heptose 1,7-bisphosphate phosphatase [Thiotrichaceae bacterium IS1]